MPLTQAGTHRWIKLLISQLKDNHLDKWPVVCNLCQKLQTKCKIKIRKKNKNQRQTTDWNTSIFGL